MDAQNKDLAHAAGTTLRSLGRARRDRWRLAANALAELAGRAAGLHSLGRQLALCAERGYDRAAARCLTGLDALLREVQFHVQEARRAPWTRARQDPPTFRDLIADLGQLQDEFEEVGYDRRARKLSVSTPPIAIEGVPLGPFEIALRLDALADECSGAPYTVEALDPNPAASNDSVTHPHVSDGRLCAGDAAMSIQAALRSGRICDFFLLVRAVLTTYNPNSPFVQIEEWNGVSCRDCGYTMDPDDARWCRVCEHDFCRECATICERCEETVCNECGDGCPVCGDGLCSRCMSECPDCERRLCRGCLEDGDCPCQEENPLEDQADDDDAGEEPVEAGVGGEAGESRDFGGEGS